MAIANIAIEVNGQQAANALKQITTASQQLESAVNNTTTKINNQNSATSSASNQLKGYTKSTQVATAATNGLKGAVANLLGAFTAISAAKFVFAKTAELESQTKSLEVLTGSVTKAKAIIQELQQLGAVTPFTSTELIDSAKRLNAFGVEGDKVVETTRRLADVAGATGAELQGLVTAYGQVQAKGRLQGEELLQFQERGVALQEELRKMYGLSGEELQKALSKGRISAEAVEVAIKRLTDAGGKYANGAVAQSETLQGKFSTLTDGVEQLARTIGVVLTPALKAVFTQAIQVVDAINQAMAAGSISAQTKQGFKTQAERTVSSQAGFMPGGPFGAGQITIKANGKTYKGDAASVTSAITNDLINKEVARRTSAATKAGSAKSTATTAGIPELLAETGGGKRKGKSAEERAAEKAAREAARLREETQKQLDSASRLSDLAEANLEIQVSSNVEERLKSEFDKASIERRMRFIDLQKQAKSEQERELLASAQLSEILIANNQYAKDRKTLLEQQLKPLQDIITANKTKLEDDKAYQRLIAEGINPEIAKQYVEIDRAGKALQESLQPSIDLANAAVLEAEARGASADEVARLKKALEELQKLPGKKVEEAKGTIVPEAPKSFKESVTGERDKIKNELDELTKASNLVAFGAKAIGDSFATSFKGIVSGAMGAKEALSSFFKGIADAFLDMAAQIIAKWITMTILNSVLSLFPGGSKTGGGGGGGLTGLNTTDFMKYSAFAEGGFVTAPTNALIGEGGQPEYVIPASKMRESMSRYAAGARGSAVIGNGTSDGDLGGGAATMNGSTIDVRYTVERINSVDYVTASQFQQGMQKAAMEGAQRGQQATLRRLQNSSSTRRSVGI